MQPKTLLVVAAILLAVSAVLNAAAWSWKGPVVKGSGTIVSYGFNSVEVDFGEIEPGETITENATIDAWLPCSAEVEFFVNTSLPEGVEWSVAVYVNGHYFDTITRDHNVTIILGRGHHRFVFESRIENINATATKEFYFNIIAQASER